MKKALFERRTQLIIVLLCAVTIAVYWQVKSHEFVDADDPLYITENMHVQGGMTFDNLAWAFTTGYAANWHPLTWISHMIDCQVYGQNPAGHHLTNVFFHIVNTVLLFLVLAEMTGGLRHGGHVWQSAFAAAVFALHPLHVESVAWAAERKNVLSAFFWLLTMLVYMRYVDHPRMINYLLLIFSFALGLMAKPMLVTLPFVLLLLDYWPLRRFEVTRANDERKRFGKFNPANPPTRASMALHLVREKIPLIVLSVISSVITFIVQQRGEAIPTWRSLPLGVRVANALIAYVRYIGKTLWPSDLAVFYPHPMNTLPVWQPFAAGLLLVGITVLFIRVRKSFPYLLVGWLWFLGTLVPVLGLVQVGEQSMADRYMYVPLIGLSIIVAWGVTDLLARWRHRRIILAVASVVILFSMTVRSFSQVTTWSDSMTLFEHASQVTSDNYVAITSVGSALQSQGKLEGAIEHYMQSLRINNSYELAHYNLAVALQAKGETEKAIPHYSEAIRLKPDEVGAYYGLGLALSEKGAIQQSIPYYLKALQLNPDYWQAHYGVALAFTRLGLLKDAIAHYDEALRLKPDYPDAHFNLGIAWHRMGELDKAIPHYSEAIRLKPDYALAHSNLGTALHEQGKLKEAIAQYREALRLNPNLTDAHHNLQIALERQQRAEKP